jgi:hypothetical protein
MTDDAVHEPPPDWAVEELLRIETHDRLMNTFAILCAIWNGSSTRPIRVAAGRSTDRCRSSERTAHCTVVSRVGRRETQSRSGNTPRTSQNAFLKR